MLIATYFFAGLAALCACGSFALGFAGLTGKLARQGHFGIKTPDALSSDAAFTHANRVAGAGQLAVGLICAFGAGLGFALANGTGLLLTLISLVAGIYIFGRVCILGAQAVAGSAENNVNDENPAADCGQSAGCGSCAVRDACMPEDTAKPEARQ